MTPLPNSGQSFMQLKGQHNSPINSNVRSVYTLCHCKTNEVACVATPHSYTPACCRPAGTRSLLKERTGIEKPHSPSALSLARLRLAQNRCQATSGTSQATKQRFLKVPSPKMSVLFQIFQHRHCTAIIYT